MTRILTILLPFLLTCSLRAGTFFIDYGSGSDSANGTSTNTPWQRCPGMNGFTGSYSHSAGDVFVFKGGVTWPSGCFPFSIANSGGSGNPDIYQSSTVWYSIATNALFDLQNAYIGSGGINSAIAVSGNYVTIDGFEIKNLYIPNSTNWNAFGVASVQQISSGNLHDLTVIHCYIHDWTSELPAGQSPNNTDSDFGGIFLGGSGAVIQNRIGPGDPPSGYSGNCGCGVSGYATEITSNTITGCTDMINSGCPLIRFNNEGPGANSYDPVNHANAIYGGYGTGQTVSIYANTIHDLGSTYQTMLLHPGASGATNVALFIYNNIIWNVASPVDIDEYNISVPNSATVTHFFNNTMVGTGIGAVKRNQTYHLTEFDCENNFWINDGPLNPIFTAAVTSAYAPVGTVIDTSNLMVSVSTAAADGYTAGNGFAPTASTSPTVGAATNLTSLGLFTTDFNGNPRPATGAWDVGAYEFQAALSWPAPGGSPWFW